MRALLLSLALLVPLAAPAVQPDEILDDPALEARAREISSGLRCLVCRNESIDDSNADFSRTMRLLVRERVNAGDSNEEVLEFIVARYGEYVLLQPKFTVANALIWLSGPLLLVVGGGIAWRFTAERHRAEASTKATPAPLSEDEEKRLAALLDGHS